MHRPNAPRRWPEPKMIAHRIHPAPPWQVGPATWDFQRPLIMGVLNATPDSFSDGGDYLDVERAVARGRELAAEGADLIDLGGASSHPRARPVPPREELRRIRPILERLLAEVSLPLSVDTQAPEVAEACLEMGAHVVNDVSGLSDLRMVQVAARFDAPLVVTYNSLKVPRDRARHSLLASMMDFFEQRVTQAHSEGLARMILDPGYGFGKTLAENLTVLRHVQRLHRLRRPVLVCTSRKGSLGTLTGEPDPKQRLGATLASSLYAVLHGADMVRIHDVRQFRQALVTWDALAHPPGGG